MPKHWNIGEAKQNLSQVVRDASTDPQLLFNRDEFVAAVIGVDEWRKLEEVRGEAAATTLAEAFEGLRSILAEEDYTLSTRRRTNRTNPIPDVLDDLPR